MADPYASIASPIGQQADPYAAIAMPAISGGGVQDFEPRQFTTGEKVSRKVGLAAQGMSDALYGAAMVPADISGWIARQTGLASPDAAPPSRQVTNALASVPSAVGLASPDAAPRIEPAGAGERAVYGASEGVGNALAMMTGAGAVANTTRGVTQGVANVLRQQPVMQTAAAATGGAVGGATENPWAGLAASLAVPFAASGVRRAGTPITNVLTPQEQRLATAATNEGIPLTAAQRTGSPNLEFAESTMAKIPGSAGPMQNAFRGQHQQFNRATLGRAGVTATDASPPVIDQAYRAAGQTFDDLAARTTLRPDPQFGADVRDVVQNYGRRLDTDVAGVFRSYIADLEPLLQAIAPGRAGSTLPAVQSTANPQISGEVYQTIRSDITQRMRESQNNKPLQRALGGLVEALDDVMERSTTGALRAEWQEARRQYQALSTIDKAMQGGTQETRSVGDIPFGSLTNAVRGGDRAGYARGRGQLNEMSRIGDFIADKVPNSGTATRQFGANPLNWLYMAPANVISRAYNTAPVQNYLADGLGGINLGRTNYGAQLGGIGAREVLDREPNQRGGRR